MITEIKCPICAEAIKNNIVVFGERIFKEEYACSHCGYEYKYDNGIYLEKIFDKTYMTLERSTKEEIEHTGVMAAYEKLLELHNSYLERGKIHE